MAFSKISFKCDIDINKCGDGIIQNPNDHGQFETCDDGNDIDDDECNNICEPNHEVPEFTTIGAGLALLGAAGIAMRRKKN